MSENPPDNKFDGCSDTPEKPRHRLSPQSYAEFRNRPKLTWIIKKILPRGELLVIYGAPGSGKSFLAMDMALSIARGVDWMGYKTKPGRVVYVCAEDANGLAQRLRAYEEKNGLNIEDFDNFQIIPVPPNFLEDTDNEMLIQLIGKADVIIFDTFARITTGADENSGKDMGPVILRLQKLHLSTGAMIGLVHHSGKDATKGSRGWSGLKGAVDTEIEVTGTTGTRKAVLQKQKNGPPGMEWHFSLVSYSLGTDEDGDEISSCYYEAADPPYVPEFKNKRKLGGWQEAVMNTFEDTIDDESNSFILEEVLIDLTVQNSATPPKNERDTRKQKIRNALTTLYVRKLLQVKDGKVFKY